MVQLLKVISALEEDWELGMLIASCHSRFRDPIQSSDFIGAHTYLHIHRNKHTHTHLYKYHLKIKVEIDRRR